MAIVFARDSNGVALHGPEGLRPDFAHIKVITTSGSIQELDISAMIIAANKNEQNMVLLRVVCIGNPCYFSLGVASSAPSDSTTMMLLPASTPIHIRANSTDVSLYALQITGAGTLQVSALS